jgi:hypothetical protein
MPSPPLHLQTYEDLARSIAGRLAASRDGEDPLAPWQLEVIVASSGVARAISEQLARLTPHGVAALRLHTIESFAQRTLNERDEYPRVATPAERRLAMRAASLTVDHPMMETRGTPAMLERSYRDVRDGALSVGAIAARSKSDAIRNRDRLRAILRAWEEYERLIAKLGAIDPSDLLAGAAKAIRAGAVIPQQIVAGFYDMTGAQAAVIDALQAVEKVAAVHVPVDPNRPIPYAFATPFLQRFAGAPLAPREASLDIRKSPWTIDEHRTREDEARAVAAAIAERLAAGAEPSSIGVAARSLEPYDIALLARFAREHGFSFSTRPALPLIAHRIGRAAVMLLSLRERDFPRGEVLELARSGLRTQTRINPDKADYETRRAMIAGGRSASLEHRAASSLAIRDYVALVAELEALTERIDASALARLIDQFRIENTEDLAAVQALDEIARMFARAERWNRPMDIRAVIDAIEQVTLDPSPAPAGIPAIWLGDVMRLRGRTFAELFVIRVQDDVVPQRRTEDPLLPDADRRAVGIREIGNGREEEALLFELMRGRTVTRFSYASSDGFGKPLRASQSLKAFAIAEVPGEKTAILKRFSAFAASRASGLTGHWTLGLGPPGASESNVQGLRSNVLVPAAPTQRSMQLFAQAGSRSLFDGYVTTPLLQERTLAALQSISPTQLEDFGECPQKFLLKHLLGVSDIDNPDREVQINHREKGIVDHEVLERFYRSLPEAAIRDAGRDLPRLTEVLRDRLEQIIDEEFDKLEEKIPAFNRSMRAMERRATKRVLSSFVAADLADMLERDLMPAHFEYKFGQKHKRRAPDHPEPFIIETGGVPIRVEGTIDRIDIGHGQYRIVDYKSGKALRHEGLAPKIDRGVRLQLPLYAMAVASFFEVPPSAVSGTIKPIARTETSLDKFAFELGETEERLRQTLEIFVNAITRGAFPAFPNESDKDFNSCKYCPVNHSCRTKHDPDERRTALETGDPRTLLEAQA